MEFKNFAKGLGTYFFAEVLCLFLAVTLSAVGGGLFRLISCICTIAVLVCVCVNYALNRAKEDQHRKLPNTIGRQLFYGVAAAAVSRAGADAVPGESRRIAGTLVSVVQAAGCAVFAALQPLQHGCDHFVPLLGKNHFSGALESAACGGGVGNLCPCPERIPAGETAV